MTVDPENSDGDGRRTDRERSGTTSGGDADAADRIERPSRDRSETPNDDRDRSTDPRDDPFGDPYPDRDPDDPFGDPYPESERDLRRKRDGSADDRATHHGSDGASDDRATHHGRDGASDDRATHHGRDGTSDDRATRRDHTVTPVSDGLGGRGRQEDARGQDDRHGGPGDTRRRSQGDRRSFDAGRWTLGDDHAESRGRSRPADDGAPTERARPSFDPGASGSHQSTRSWRDRRSTIYGELNALEGTMQKEHLKKPYLERIPDGYDAELAVMEWIESLITTAGREATLDALAYYRSIGWVASAVHSTLEEHANTIAQSAVQGDRQLTMEDHRRSLRAIARIVQSGHQPE